MASDRLIDLQSKPIPIFNIVCPEKLIRLLIVFADSPHHIESIVCKVAPKLGSPCGRVLLILSDLFELEGLQIDSVH